MKKHTPRVLVVATSRKTRGGITSVVKAHETGEQWKKYHCRWIQTHRDGPAWRKIWYLVTALIEYSVLLPWYDIVHIHVGLRTSVNRKLIFAKLAHVLGKKIIVHFHPATEKHLFDSEFSGKIKCLFGFSDRLIVLSPQWVTWIDEAFPDNNFKMSVVYNPCPRVKRDFNKRKKEILYAGILSDRKGYNRLLEAFAKVYQQFPDWKLVFAGNGELDKAEELREELNIPKDKVVFLGWVSGIEKSKTFQSASIYCLPSWGEGFPMGVLDALAYGIPVVTTPVGGVEQVLHNGRDCLIFDTYDTNALARCLECLMKDEKLRSNLACEADKLVNTCFNIQQINSEIGQIYEEIICQN